MFGLLGLSRGPPGGHALPFPQGNRLNGSSGSCDDLGKVILVPGGFLTAVLETDGRLCLCQQVEVRVLDDGHVGWPMTGSQAGEVIAEDDIEHPVQSVLDAPMSAHDASEAVDVEPGRAEIVALLPLDRAVSLGLTRHHADGGQSGEAELARIAAGGEQPVDIMADCMAAGLDPAVFAVDG